MNVNFPMMLFVFLPIGSTVQSAPMIIPMTDRPDETIGNQLKSISISNLFLIMFFFDPGKGNIPNAIMVSLSKIWKGASIAT